MIELIVGIGIIGYLGFLSLAEGARKVGVKARDVVASGGNKGRRIEDGSIYGPLYERYGKRFNLNPRLLRAIAMVESSENHLAVSPASAYGLMQVLCRADGPDKKCENQFNITGWHDMTQNRLLEAENSVRMGAQILAWNVQTYGFHKGIAVYNSWSARKAPQGGPYPNQVYVDRVLTNLAVLGGGGAHYG